MNRNYTPIRPLIRCTLATAALAATVASWSLVDALARGYAAEALHAAGTQQVVLAKSAQ